VQGDVANGHIEGGRAQIFQFRLFFQGRTDVLIGKAHRVIETGPDQIKLVSAFHEFSFEVAVETNGTKEASSNIDWICVSPKTKVSDLVLTSGNELKFVYPQETIQPEQFENFEFDLFYLVPMDGKDKQKNTQLSAEYCLKNPKWKLSLQMHKLIGLP